MYIYLSLSSRKIEPVKMNGTELRLCLGLTFPIAMIATIIKFWFVPSDRGSFMKIKGPFLNAFISSICFLIFSSEQDCRRETLLSF